MTKNLNILSLFLTSLFPKSKNSIAGMKVLKTFIPGVILIFSFHSCESFSSDSEYKTLNVVIIIIDGARYSESWGDTSGVNIPNMKSISHTGILYTNFYNNGPTYTLSGHTSITTGNYQEINNLGREIPQSPSLFQYWNKIYSKNFPISRIFASKDKLAVLSDCEDTSFNGNYRPSDDCGINGTGVGSGFRHDSVTLRRALNALKTEHPRLLLISFREPDFSAHQNNWQAYINGIKNTDNYVYQLWDFIENNSFYQDKTALFITNDHGRHLDSVSDGYVSHGDTCNGCKHISLLALGPDFKRGEVLTNRRELIDIPATIAEILRFSMPAGHGKIMNEIFK